MWKPLVFSMFRLINTTGLLLLLPMPAFPFSALTPAAAGKVWAQRIQSQPTNVSNALDVIRDINQSSHIKFQEKAVVEALRVCGRCERPDLALQIYRAFPQIETCRTMTISVMGSCNQLNQALQLLEESADVPLPNIGSYNAAIAACGKAKDWKRALQVYHRTVHRGIAKSLTCNALLTVLAKQRQGQEALQILKTMPCKPDRLTYQYVISALSRSHMADQAYQVLEELKEGNTDTVQVTDAMYELVISAYHRQSNYSAIQRVERLRNPDFEPAHWSSPGLDAHFQRWSGLTKIGKGKDAYWEIATIRMSNSNSIIVGAHPHRNPAKNGIQLVFFEQRSNDAENDPCERRKLGYLLMQNTKNHSRFLGMYLQGQSRKRGLAKVCLAFWFWLCLQAQVTPTTGIINKPLLALLLQHHFGMESNGKGGMEMEVSPDPRNHEYIQLYARSRKNLRGVFSPWDVQHQKLHLLKEPPTTRGRIITVGTAFGLDQSGIAELASKIELILPESNIDHSLAGPHEFHSLFFGGEKY